MTKAEARDRIDLLYDGQDAELLQQAVDAIPLTSGDAVDTGAGLPIGQRDFETPITEGISSGVNLPTEFNQQGSGAAITSRWIREHLQDVDEDYTRRMWKRYTVFRIVQIPENVVEGDEIQPAQSYDTFGGKISMLNNLGLIGESGRTEPSKAGGFERVFYEVTNPDSPMWDNPQGAMYPGSTPATFREVVQDLTDDEGRPPTPNEVAEQLDIDPSTAALRAEAWDIDLATPEEA